MNEAQIIDEKLKKYYESLVKTYPRHTTWASDAGHPCLRYLVLLRTTPHEQIMPLPAELQPLLRSGEAIHKLVEEDLREAGCYIYTSPDSLYDKELEVSGKMDHEIGCEEFKAMPIEIKSVDDYIIDKYNSAIDLINGDYWSRKYVSQLALYLWMRGKEKGIIHLRSRRRWKNIIISILDPGVIDFVHNLLENLKKVNEHVKNNILPDRIPYNSKLCKNCSIKIICLPDEQLSEGQIIFDEELEKKLNRRQELVLMKKEFDDIDKDIKELFKKLFRDKDNINILIGNYQITGKRTARGFQTKIEKINNSEQEKNGKNLSGL